MGFGVKTDFATGRKLDLNKSYRLLIKPVAEEKGLVCIRADEIRHSGAIDVPMYEQLLTADVVIADLSTANPNALYELGIRHALRPRTTIVISENKLPYPFDLNHVMITGYTHLGESIDYDEVMDFRKKLGATLEAVLVEQKTDSPVYTFLHQLTPPSLRDELRRWRRPAQALEQAGEALAEAGAGVRTAEAGPADKTLAILTDQGEQAIKESRFSDAKAAFELALRLCKGDPAGISPAAHEDTYLIQRLILATYKAKQPDELSALNEALKVLDTKLNLKDSNDPETVGLAGAIEKRLFDKAQGAEHLARAIRYYARGYYLRNDRYNGINLAYLLNVRTDTSLDTTNEDKIADLVFANRIRRDVLALCEEELEIIQRRAGSCEVKPDKIKAEQQARDLEEKFWLLATQAEAYFGLGELMGYQKSRSAAQALQPAAWMMESFDQQIGRLKSLLEKHGHLSTPRGRPRVES